MRVPDLGEQRAVHGRNDPSTAFSALQNLRSIAGVVLLVAFAFLFLAPLVFFRRGSDLVVLLRAAVVARTQAPTDLVLPGIDVVVFAHGDERFKFQATGSLSHAL